MIRGVVAVVAGYLVFGVSGELLFAQSGHDPKVWPGWTFAVLSTPYGMAFAFAGGYLAARIGVGRTSVRARLQRHGPPDAAANRNGNPADLAAAGESVVARVSGKSRYPLTVAGTIAIIALASMLLQPHNASIWSEVAVLLFMAPAAAAAGLCTKS